MAGRKEPITVESGIIVDGEWQSIDSMTCVQRMRVATQLAARMLNEKYAGHALFTADLPRDDTCAGRKTDK